MGNGTVNFKVSVDTFLLYEHYHKVIRTVCERIYMTFMIKSFTEQLLCDFYVCHTNNCEIQHFVRLCICYVVAETSDMIYVYLFFYPIKAVLICILPGHVCKL